MGKILRKLDPCQLFAVNHVLPQVWCQAGGHDPPDVKILPISLHGDPARYDIVWQVIPMATSRPDSNTCLCFQGGQILQCDPQLWKFYTKTTQTYNFFHKIPKFSNSLQKTLKYSFFVFIWNINMSGLWNALPPVVAPLLSNLQSMWIVSL